MVTTMSMTLLLVLKKLGEPVSGTFLTIPLEHVTKYLDLESPFLSCQGCWEGSLNMLQHRRLPSLQRVPREMQLRGCREYQTLPQGELLVTMLQVISLPNSSREQNWLPCFCFSPTTLADPLKQDSLYKQSLEQAGSSKSASPNASFTASQNLLFSVLPDHRRRLPSLVPARKRLPITNTEVISPLETYNFCPTNTSDRSLHWQREIGRGVMWRPTRIGLRERSSMGGILKDLLGRNSSSITGTALEMRLKREREELEDVSRPRMQVVFLSSGVWLEKSKVSWKSCWQALSAVSSKAWLRELLTAPDLILEMQSQYSVTDCRFSIGSQMSIYRLISLLRFLTLLSCFYCFQRLRGLVSSVRSTSRVSRSSRLSLYSGRGTEGGMSALLYYSCLQIDQSTLFPSYGLLRKSFQGANGESSGFLMILLGLFILPP